MDMNRREMLKTTVLGTLGVVAGSGLLASRATAQTPAPAPAPEGGTAYCTLPPLAYACDALEPHIDAQTMEIHHDKHHAAYVKGLNAAVATEPSLASRSPEDLVAHWPELPANVQTAVRNHGGGHVNHTLFWASLSPAPAAPSGAFEQALVQAFGGVDGCREQLTKAALGVFGSGWAWLCLGRDGALKIETTPNQDNPLTAGCRPLLGIDVWEHAYYLKHQNRRADYLTALFNVIDWQVVAARHAAV